MKNTRLFLAVSIIVLIIFVSFTSCTGTGVEPRGYESTHLIGKWRCGTDHQVYKEDQTGYTWDIADDVREEEAQKFTWTLEVDILTHIHIFEVKADGTRAVPKVYVVKELNDSILEYQDEFTGKIRTFEKINTDK